MVGSAWLVVINRRAIHRLIGLLEVCSGLVGSGQGQRGGHREQDVNGGAEAGLADGPEQGEESSG